jgi:hypothetical protein
VLHHVHRVADDEAGLEGVDRPVVVAAAAEQGVAVAQGFEVLLARALGTGQVDPEAELGRVELRNGVDVTLLDRVEVARAELAQPAQE